MLQTFETRFQPNPPPKIPNYTCHFSELLSLEFMLIILYYVKEFILKKTIIFTDAQMFIFHLALFSW